MKRIGSAFLLVSIAAVCLWAAETGDAKKGKVVYTRACQKCHGPDGSGVEAIAKALKVTLVPLSSEEAQKKTDEEINKIINEGGGKMKRVPGLSPEDVKDVIAFVRSLASKEK